jgi:hypothetical protein
MWVARIGLMLICLTAGAPAADSPLIGVWHTTVEKNGQMVGMMIFHFLPNGRFEQQWVKLVDPSAQSDIEYFGDYVFDGNTLEYKVTQWRAGEWPFAAAHVTPPRDYVGSDNTGNIRFTNDGMTFQGQFWQRGEP